ncbi:MAG: selenocysteine-specific translation elongation factor [Desulfobacteraceae bacterium]|nr:selenocysteine-specific translation elongation factor [Desulfobacteraceae bacterium]
MRELILGTAGHVDHGKTSLIRALTGIDTDRLKEEKERGITIELGFAFLDLPCGHRLGIVDVPGHERFVKNMVAGASGIDLVAFVIAADEGIMPQTREHFDICRLLGVERGLVVLTKIDMVDPEWLELVQEEVREFFAGSFLAEAPLVRVSAVTGEGIPEVRSVLDRLVRESELTEAYGPFRLPVDRVFAMKGFGAVVTGTSMSGRIGVGEEVVVYPKGIAARIRGIQVHGGERKEVEAGNRTAINLQGVEKEAIGRGDVLASPDSLRPSYVLDADFLYLAGNAKPLKNRTRVRVHLGTAEIMGRIALLEQEELEPGATADVQLLLEEPVGTWPGDRYVVRSYSPVYTIGGGGILNGAAPKRRRFKEANREVFALYHEGTPEDLVLLHLREAGVGGLTASELAIKMGVFGNRLKKILNGPISARQVLVADSERQRLVAAGVYNGLKERTLAILAEFHQQQPLKPGLSKEELRTRIHRQLDPRLFQMLLQELIQKEGKLAQDEASVRLASHQVALAASDQNVRDEVEALYRRAGLQPPTVKEVLAQLAGTPRALVQEILEMLARERVTVKITEELYFHAASLDDLQQRLVALLQKEGEIDAQGFKALTGLTRKFSIPLLEYFDRNKITIRVGDKRILRERRT